MGTTTQSVRNDVQCSLSSGSSHPDNRPNYNRKYGIEGRDYQKALFSCIVGSVGCSDFGACPVLGQKCRIKQSASAASVSSVPFSTVFLESFVFMACVHY